MTEAEFKSWFRRSWKGWVESYEPRRGTGVGMADLQIVVERMLVPVELKVGKIKNGKLFPEEVRPDQVGWHKRLNMAGVNSIFLVGIGLAKVPEHVYAIRPDMIATWRNGFDLLSIKRIDELNSGLLRFVRMEDFLLSGI